MQTNGALGVCVMGGAARLGPKTMRAPTASVNGRYNLEVFVMFWGD